MAGLSMLLMGRLVGVRGVRLRMGLGNENRAWRDEVDGVDEGVWGNSD